MAFSDLSLLAFMPIVQSDYGTGSSISGFKFDCLPSVDGYVMVVIIAMNLELLAVSSLVVDYDVVHGTGLVLSLVSPEKLKGKFSSHAKSRWNYLC